MNVVCDEHPHQQKNGGGGGLTMGFVISHNWIPYLNWYSRPVPQQAHRPGGAGQISVLSVTFTLENIFK